MRHHDASGERAALAERYSAGPDGAGQAGTPDASQAEALGPDRAVPDGAVLDEAEPGEAEPDGTQPDPAEPEAAEREAPGPGSRGRLDDLQRRLEGLRASHPSSPGYGGHRDARQAPAGPLRDGEPYRPWFSGDEPGEPWFTTDPADPHG
ncbi:MAG TPA: hypothetical protein VK162_25660 [Streptosporangiaceae bacterium]|nr:hypothetical protein [Streptosporangiaceae bacterium]